MNASMNGAPYHCYRTYAYNRDQPVRGQDLVDVFRQAVAKALASGAALLAPPSDKRAYERREFPKNTARKRLQPRPCWHCHDIIQPRADNHVVCAKVECRKARMSWLKKRGPRRTHMRRANQ